MAAAGRGWACALPVRSINGMRTPNYPPVGGRSIVHPHTRTHTGARECVRNGNGGRLLLLTDRRGQSLLGAGMIVQSGLFVVLARRGMEYFSDVCRPLAGHLRESE